MQNSTSTTTTATTSFSERLWVIRESQATRYEEICRHFRDEIDLANQLESDEAELAGDRGFILVQGIFDDIEGADGLVSRIASARLKDLVHFCLDHAYRVGPIEFVQDRNSLRSRRGPWQEKPERNWMARRGMWLLRDLEYDLDLWASESVRLRRFMVHVWTEVSDRCFAEETAEEYLPGGKSGRIFWKQAGTASLHALRVYKNDPDPFIRDAGTSALATLHLREDWRAIVEANQME